MRLEIEYDPAAYTKDMFKHKDDQIIQEIIRNVINSSNKVSLHNLEKKEELLEKHINKLNKTDPVVVLEDLGKVLINLFNSLDLESGNKEYKREQKEQMEKERIEKVVRNPSENDKNMFKTMRFLHNRIKENLIYRVSRNIGKDKQLLDISVGNGGDIIKWDKADINTVYGIDPNSIRVDEANKRFIDLKEKKVINKGRNYTFEVLGIVDNEIRPGFDIVSCQFTMHYFFENDDKLERMVEHVSKSLKIGGYFIGTTLIGDRIKKFDSKKYSKYINLIRNDISYTMKFLGETMYNEELLEYYVDFNKLIKICKKYNLELEEIKEFKELHKLFNDVKLREYEAEISKLSSSFIFIKKEDSDSDSDSEDTFIVPRFEQELTNNELSDGELSDEEE